MSRRGYRPTRRRRRGRYEPTSVLLVTEDDRTFYVASAGRLLWRYRSELAPFAVALAAAVGASWAHARHPGAALPLLALTVAATGVLTIPPIHVPDRLRELLSRWAVYARTAERLYAASVIALGGLWLTAATAWGPSTPPLPTVALLGTVAAGVPWWTHHRRRARVRVTRTLDAWPTFAESVGLPGSRLVSAVVDRWGWTGRLALRRGQTVAQAIGAVPAVESALGVRPGAVRVEPDPARADRAVVRVVELDPLAAPVKWPDPLNTEGKAPSIVDPIELGLFEDGSPVLVQLAYRNALLGGMIGSGKSGVLNVLLAVLVACRDVVVWGVDLKGGMELRPWADCLGRLATTPAEAIELFHDAISVRDHRTATAPGRLWQPSRQDPALLLVVDEFAELPDEAKALADSVSRIGRAVMVNLIAATQRPTQDAMGGGATRPQMDVRICLRVRERRDVDLILDRGSQAAGWRADLLDAPGKLLLSDPEHRTPQPARAYLLPDEDVAQVASRYANRQPAIAVPDRTILVPLDRGRHSLPDAVETAAVEGDALLWTVLTDAPAEGVTVAELVDATGLSRATVYRRLRLHADTERAEQLGEGRWRAVHH
jgi:DNA segregation ATPase FtsK/SpoIIIE, S-DNA-T family